MVASAGSTNLFKKSNLLSRSFTSAPSCKRDFPNNSSQSPLDSKYSVRLEWVIVFQKDAFIATSNNLRSTDQINKCKSGRRITFFGIFHLSQKDNHHYFKKNVFAYLSLLRHVFCSAFHQYFKKMFFHIYRFLDMFFCSAFQQIQVFL